MASGEVYRIAKESGQFVTEEARNIVDVYVVAVNGYIDPAAFNHEWRTNYSFTQPQSLDTIAEYFNEYSSEFPNNIRNCLGLILKDQNDELALFPRPISIGT